MRRGEEVVTAARALLGVRFRPQGRSAATGVDCIGLVASALGVAAPARDYDVRHSRIERLTDALARAGLRRVEDAAPGDVLVMRPGAGQLHLAVATGDGFVHCDARLGRVVERPGPAPWPVGQIWRGGT